MDGLEQIAVKVIEMPSDSMILFAVFFAFLLSFVGQSILKKRDELKQNRAFLQAISLEISNLWGFYYNQIGDKLENRKKRTFFILLSHI